MYFPSQLQPGDVKASVYMEIGKQYLLTVTGTTVSTTLEFQHGDDPAWYPVNGWDPAAVTNVVPIYCNGRIRLSSDAGNALVYVSCQPIIIRDN